MSDWFLSSIEPYQHRFFFNLLIDVFPQSLIEKFFNELINYSNYTADHYVIFNKVTIDKLFVKANVESRLWVIDSDIETFDCNFYREKDLKDFLLDNVKLNIQRLIIDKPFGLYKEDIEELLSVNSSSVKEIIFKK